MKFAYTNERMRALDARTIETGTPSSVLMERAGKALAERVRAVMQERKIGDALFVCGTTGEPSTMTKQETDLPQRGICANGVARRKFCVWRANFRPIASCKRKNSARIWAGFRADGTI